MIYLKKKIGKQAATVKQNSRAKNKANKTPDQKLNLAAEKLESTLRNLNAGKAMSTNVVPADKQKLISRAIAIQRAQSKLLDELDDDTRQRLRALALELMVFKKGKKP